MFYEADIQRLWPYRVDVRTASKCVYPDKSFPNTGKDHQTRFRPLRTSCVVVNRRSLRCRMIYPAEKPKDEAKTPQTSVVTDDPWSKTGRDRGF